MTTRLLEITAGKDGVFCFCLSGSDLLCDLSLNAAGKSQNCFNSKSINFASLINCQREKSKSFFVLISSGESSAGVCLGLQTVLSKLSEFCASYRSLRPDC